MKRTFYTFKRAQKGFTLIELIVSLGLFSVVMTISAGAVLAILDANAKAQSAGAVMTNLNIALDGMTREMRTGTTFSCGGLSQATTFSFITQDGINTTYTRVAGDATHLPSITKQTNGGVAVAITSPEISVDNLQFYCTGLSTSDYIQPLIRVVVQGKAGTDANLIARFDIQTSVAQRLLDF